MFGENYAQELLDKAPQLPVDIQGHFIGHLQTNKVGNIDARLPYLTAALSWSLALNFCSLQVKPLLSLPNLACVESVDRVKLASRIPYTLFTLHPDPKP